MIVSKYDIIKNYDSLATTPGRVLALDMIEDAFHSIEPRNVMKDKFRLDGSYLKVGNDSLDLKKFDNVYVVGFGKGSGLISHIVEDTLGTRLSDGYVIDVVDDYKGKMNFTRGDHPKPTRKNYEFTSDVIERFEGNVTEKDLFLVPVCGGGSAMLVQPPEKIGFEKKLEINEELLKGLSIYEMNTVRKHVSEIKGGGLAKILYPAKTVSMIFSDVPGNDMSVIASGPTVKDVTTVEDAWKIMQKYGIAKKLDIEKKYFVETPKNRKYFNNASYQIILTNKTPLKVMGHHAQKKGYKVYMISDQIQGEARDVGKQFASKMNGCGHRTVFLQGGETTVTVKGGGTGGRNQEFVMGALDYLGDGVTIASVGSDGWDYEKYAGAIGDSSTVSKAKEKGLDIKDILDDNNSMRFFDKTGDGIVTGKKSSNVADLMILVKE